MLSLYRNESSDPKVNAQRNLAGRTHYVDDETLRYHKSRVLQSRHHDEGLLFSIVTSDALDYQNTRRGFRYVIFDLFGHVIDRPDLRQAFRTSEQASQARYAALNKLDACALTRAAIEREREYFDREISNLLHKVSEIEAQTVRTA